MIAQIITLVATVGTAGMVMRARPAVRHTTLTAAWTWAVIAAASWCVAAATSIAVRPESSAVGQAWYVAAVLTLCPWIAVLGARRPTVRVWNWFVVVPLVAVLLWPVALCWTPRGPNRLTLEMPHLLGFALVLLMGLGNYLGTRFTWVALLTLLGEFMLIAALDPRSRSSSMGLLAVAACGQMNAVIAAYALGQGSGRLPAGPNRLWTDFRNSFGIVWANRLSERVNAEAAKSGWAVRLRSDGFVAADPHLPADLDRDAASIDHALRWLLRRFVDDEWILERLSPHAEPGLKDGGSLAGNDSIAASSTGS
jgi:hypothetical protein